MPKELLAPEYAKHLNTSFRESLENGESLTLELLEVIDRTGPAGYESFSLMFRAPNTTPIQQRMYRLEHDVMDASNIFLVPISQNEDGIVFEAAFNRRLD
jgi:hypothetical protein